jgi:murein DD-endopeptidase MepM/ murein hydrolase activator NlpD
MTRQNDVMPQQKAAQNQAAYASQNSNRLLAQRLGLGLSSFGMLSMTVTQAQAVQAPILIQEAAPASTEAQAATGNLPTAIAAPENFAPEKTPQVAITPSPEVPMVEIETRPAPAAAKAAPPAAAPEPVLIDRGLPATEAPADYSAPAQIEITERGSGCEAQLKWGQSVASSFCGTGTAAVAPVKGEAAAPKAGKPGETPILPVPAVPGETAADPQPEAAPQYAEAAPQAPIRLGPISISSAGISLSAPSSVKPYFPGKLLSLANLANLPKLQMVFPVAIPAPITSLFGWRIHPITGASRMHTGTDIGAPMGTPVMAALAGRVIMADMMGGYGLAVAVEHDNGARQTLYAHMSELFVKPGDVINQGTVIGRVGSTGASTGPHLHFELRQMTTDGSWVAQDAGSQLESSLASLTQSLQVAHKLQPGMVKTAVKPTLTQPIAPMKMGL